MYLDPRFCFWSISLLPSGPPFEGPGPHGDLSQFLGPHWVPVSVLRSPFSLFGAKRTHEKSMQPLSNVGHLITCDSNTSTNESLVSLSVKSVNVSLPLKKRYFNELEKNHPV